MGSFNGFLDAKFIPPRNWSLDAPLKFKSTLLTKEERESINKIAGDKTNWKVDLSGGIQRVAIKHGCLLLETLKLES